ncbi:MAG: CocE/NonD family hydrolase [Opitutaceae bacterium]|nr:CocE/NonD family hydrolase [Opitutaceae bacterium]
MSRPRKWAQQACAPTLKHTLVAATLGVAAVGGAQDQYQVVFENNVAMKTRDGVTLRADIYRPKADGKFPVLLQRTPYDKYQLGGINFGLRAAARGYVCIIQDVRGRNASEGEWYPFKYESQDGYDAVEWAAALPYANGKVGMFGLSYIGATQMLAAMASPPHLAGIFPIITASNYYGHWVYQGGAFEQLFNQAWCSALAVHELGRRAGGTALPTYWDLKRPSTEYPLLEPGPAKGLAGYYFDWIAHPAYDDYWKQWSIEEHFDKITVPALHLAAWYDIFLDGSLRNYAGIKRQGGSAAARQGQRLVVIPGGHAGVGPKLGEIDFGKDSVLDSWELGLRWYDHLLKGIDNGMAREKPVRIFVMGKNVWRDEDDWPLARARPTRYYLHSEGKANTLSGDGRLSLAPPTSSAASARASEPADKYVYDPDDPTPTQGGALIGGPPGPLDQRAVESRSDVLVYTTPAFEQDTEVTGPVSLELYVSSSAVDTDFTGKLVDVWPNGFAQNLTDGILRMRYRNSMEKAELMNPGEVYKVTIDLWSTANVFLAGHKLRLEIASSNFPRFDRNPNTGGGPESSAAHIPATNVIHHDQDHPSALIVPIVP